MRIYDHRTPNPEEVVPCRPACWKQAITLVVGILRPEVFYTGNEPWDLCCLAGMYHAGQVIDIMTIKEELARHGKLEFIGGLYTGAYQFTRSVECPPGISCPDSQTEIYPSWTILGFHKLLALAADETTDIDDTLADAHSLLDRLEKECGTTEHLRSMLQLMEDTIKLIEVRAASNKNGVTGLPTGFTDLDRLTCGWQRWHDCYSCPSCSRENGIRPTFGTHRCFGGISLLYSLEMQGERLGDRWLLAATTELTPIISSADN